ncbi:Smg-4/UPF3 family-domain-containing protein [Ephemerocybe angulata]|uniref:Smg-4/UPF3 family-domain-containing protein n=1 Tax=Ephemerocybe angulata TaxID=980116 RepID=A0A8H6LRJ4_9AGAR|nr:Smg-4/UPF3 family-domain-containing protein [Tulosesus angulatus]
MSAATTTHSPSKSRKEKDKQRQEKNGPQQSGERLKTIVRRLPPNLPEEIFWQTVQRWVSDETSTWKVYYSGKLKKRMNKENIPSRAYIAFKDEEMLIQFSREFDGHVFKDKAGNESYAIVEYAPHQKVPSEKRKQDSKNNTIEKDEDYISFINSLNAPGEAVTLETLIAAARPPQPPKTTPLLEALKAEKSAQKDKEAILRNHAHYKDQANVAAIVSNPNRKDDKKKAPPAPPPILNQASKAGDVAAPPGKKGKKAVQAQKIAGSKSTPESKFAAPQAATTPTTSKQARQQQKQSKNAAQPAAAPPPTILAAKPPPIPAPSASASSSKSAPVQPSGSAAPNEAPQRRVRAVLGRHLEVALAGVGASARARKEREKERAQETINADSKAAAAQSTAGEPNPASSQSLSPTSAQPPPSPQRQRNRRGGGHSTSGAVPPAGNSAVPSGPGGLKSPVIAIAQRSNSGGSPSILQNGPSTSTGPVPQGVVVPPAGVPADRGRGGGGGRRGGRGKGGAGGAGRGGGPPNRGG